MSHQLPTWVCATFIAVSSLVSTPTSVADSPHVQFDVVPTSVALDITDETFQQLNPDERLIETRLQISALMQRGRQEDVTEFFYRFEVPAGTGRIVDYLPKTTMASDVVGHIHVENGQEKHQELGGSLGAGPPQAVQGSLSSSTGTRAKSSVKYEMLPPKEMVAAAGTTSRGSGAYVKLRPSKQTSLEGSKDFVLMLRVPRNWRAATLRVICQSTGCTKGGFANLETKIRICGTGSFLVPLYLAGDKQAKQAANRMADAERELFDQANNRYREIRRRSMPTVAHELNLVDPKIPDDWLARVVDHADQLAGEANYFEPYLPSEIGTAAKAYRTARTQLARLSATPSSSTARNDGRHRVAKPASPSQWTVRKNSSDSGAMAEGV